MAKKPSQETGERTPNKSADADEVAALRAMSREDRLRALMKGLDVACGPMHARRRSESQSNSPPAKPDKAR